MGLDINYNFAFHGSKDELVKKLNSIRDEITKIDVEYVSNIIEAPSIGLFKGSNDIEALALRLFYSMKTDFAFHGLPHEDVESFNERLAKEGNGVGLYVIVSEDCEPVSIILGRMGNSEKWNGFSFTKTMGAENFVKNHKKVIEILKICQEAGILESVFDEAEIWEDSD